ncbi:MAG TPA: glycosyltransferase family A protein [Rhodothermales bacterium]|nr:glycosyltransferase family A protein [Rhodothermales bacterium]
MTVSVIIPVFNGERYLPEAVESVLDQTRPASEIIVVDDGSTDGSAQVVASYGSQVGYVQQANRGTAAARNRGVDESRGELLAFLDQDDFWAPAKLELQLNVLEDQPAVGAVFGYVRQFVSPDVDDVARERFVCPDEPQEGYSPSAMIIRRSCFDEVGPFHERWRQAEWIEWLLRLKESAISTVMLQEVVAHRRIHEGNKGVVYRPATGEYLRALKESVDRRRD